MKQEETLLSRLRQIHEERGGRPLPVGFEEEAPSGYLTLGSVILAVAALQPAVPLALWQVEVRGSPEKEFHYLARRWESRLRKAA